MSTFEKWSWGPISRTYWFGWTPSTTAIECDKLKLIKDDQVFRLDGTEFPEEFEFKKDFLDKVPKSVVYLDERKGRLYVEAANGRAVYMLMAENADPARVVRLYQRMR
jgi:hypothetical protein